MASYAESNVNEGTNRNTNLRASYAIDPHWYIGMNADSSSDSDSDTVYTGRLCGEYEFKHGDVSEDDSMNPNENCNGALRVTKYQIANHSARLAMVKLMDEDNFDMFREFLEPNGSFVKCPAGSHATGTVPYNRRVHPGPFLICPVPHIQGELFEKLPFRTKVKAHTQTWRRPTFLIPVRRRYGSLWKRTDYRKDYDCKTCQVIYFTHHKDPDQHYFDYVNRVTYKGKNPDTKTMHDNTKDLKNWRTKQCESKQRRKHVKNVIAKLSQAKFPKSRKIVEPLGSIEISNPPATTTKILNKKPLKPPAADGLASGDNIVVQSTEILKNLDSKKEIKSSKTIQTGSPGSGDKKSETSFVLPVVTKDKKVSAMKQPQKIPKEVKTKKIVNFVEPTEKKKKKRRKRKNASDTYKNVQSRVDTKPPDSFKKPNKKIRRPKKKTLSKTEDYKEELKNIPNLMQKIEEEFGKREIKPSFALSYDLRI